MPSNVTEVEFAPDSAELTRLRDHTRQTLHQWGLDGLASVACLLVTELATNAIQHGRQPARLRLVHGDLLRIEVTDTHPEPPTPREPDATGGHGLTVLSGLADSWNVEHGQDGQKTVWCELLSP